ncbi:MAG: immunoglobulin domain-containing protein [Verrucomicrobia bacterium]|nr:immunoglobulin domain-containing protein [Verrucomicrobiota bacterium]
MGLAFRFNGTSNSYVEVADSPTLRLTNAVTLECWAKRLSTSEVHILVNKGGAWNGGQTDYEFALNDTYGGAHFGFGFAGGWRGCAVTPDTAWHHYAVVAVSGQANPSFYIDGVPQTVVYSGGAATMNLISSALPLHIGATLDPQTGWYYFSSTLIDETAIYGRALSASEIQYIYNAGAAGKCTVDTPPSIIVQPADQAVLVGRTVTFSITAAGTAPLGYQWQFGGTNINGATAAALMLTNVQVANAGLYSVVVTNNLGSAISSNATLTVNLPPPCAAPPPGLVSWWRAEGNASDQAGVNQGTLQNGAGFAGGEVGQAFDFDGTSQYVDVADNASLNPTGSISVEAWIYPRLPLNGIASPIVKKAGEGSGQLDGYSLETAGSSGVLFAVCLNGGQQWVLTAPAPMPIGQWNHYVGVYDGARVSIYLNGTLAATVAVSGQILPSGNHLQIGHDPADPSRYFNGLIDEAGVYNMALSAAQIQAIYQAGAGGKCTTPVAPSILVQPTNQAVVAGEDATFSVTAGGTLPLSYQWSFGGSALDGATNTSLTLPGVSTNQSGIYAVLVTNLYGAVLSSNANLTVRVLGTNLFDDFDPGIDLGQWWGFGGTVLATNYGGSVSGSNSLWFGGTGSRFAATVPLNTANGGSIRFYLRLSSGSSYPWERVDLPGKGIVLEYSINGGTNWVEMGRYASSAYYSWTKFSVPIPAGAQVASAQFRWRQLSNSGASYDHWALDDVMVLAGLAAPTIIAQPQSRVVLVGEAATFSVAATGTMPLSYQWQCNGTSISGATASSLVLTNLQFADAGVYSVTVTNAIGTATSSNATLTVNAPPPCVPAPSGLVGWWRGENNALDQAGMNHGTLQNGVGFASGEVGQAFSFSGTSYVSIPSSPSISFSGHMPMSVETWVYRTGSGSTMHILGKRGGCGYGSLQYQLAFDPSSGLSFIGDVYGTSVSTYRALPLNKWQHLAVTYDGTNFVFYIDGNAVTGVTGSLGPDTPDPLKLGDSGTCAPFVGLIDEVALYSRALTTNEVQAIYNAGKAGKCPTSFPPWILVQPTNQTATVGSNVTFSVAAGGTSPLGYQWSLGGSALEGATGASLTLTNVQMSQAGNYSVVITNAAGVISSSNVTLSVNFAPAGVRVLGVANAPSGASVMVPVVLAANGNENALSFSLAFDATQLTYVSTALGSGASGATMLLNPAQAASGKLGVILALPTGTTFPPGTQEVVQVTFMTALLTNSVLASLSFGDAPIVRALSDAPGNPLAANYAGGVVSIEAADFEGDLAPRPNGDKAVLVTDWVMAGRYAARLDYPTNAAEFQRADCAPRATLGDGTITVSDWVQVGRYAAGWDSLTAAGGPGIEIPGGNVAAKDGGQDTPKGGPPTSRLLEVADTMLVQGMTGTVPVQLQAQGNENAVGFSLSFDPAVLSYVSTSLGSASSGATVFVNASQAATGRLGVVLALGTGTSFAAGTREVVKVNFRAAGLDQGKYTVAVANQPVPCEVSDPTALRLAASYVNGTIIVNPLPSLRIARAGQEITLAWPLWATNFGLQALESGWPSAVLWTNLVTVPVLTSNETRVTLPLTSTNKLYRLHQP